MPGSPRTDRLSPNELLTRTKEIDVNPLVLTSMAAMSTSVGGCCAVLLQRRINLLMAFGSGVLVERSLSICFRLQLRPQSDRVTRPC